MPATATEEGDRARTRSELREKSRHAREEALRKVREAGEATDQMLLAAQSRVRAARHK